MLKKIPDKAQSVLFRDVLKRDTVTARRVHLLQILLREKYLSRESLIRKVEYLMGYYSFGKNSWEDIFYRDMRVVKKALKEAGFEVNYSRTKDKLGYYLTGNPLLGDDVKKEISGAIAELDNSQIEIYKKMPPAQKFFQAISIIDFGRRIKLKQEQI